MVIFNGYVSHNQRVSQLLLLWISHVERWFAVDPSRIKMIVPEAVSLSRTGRSCPIAVAGEFAIRPVHNIEYHSKRYTNEKKVP